MTENVTQTVPVSREEVRVEREPITDKNVGAARSGPNISEEEHEVVLHEERPVVEKEAVPVERVRLGTETVTDQETVSEDVRKEQIDTDLDRRSNQAPIRPLSPPRSKENRQDRRLQQLEPSSTAWSWRPMVTAAGWRCECCRILFQAVCIRAIESEKASP